MKIRSLNDRGLVLRIEEEEKTSGMFWGHLGSASSLKTGFFSFTLHVT